MSILGAVLERVRGYGSRSSFPDLSFRRVPTSWVNAVSPTDEELRAQAARIEADIAALWVKSAPRMLSEAFDPLGVDVGPWSAGSDEIFKLTVRGKGVGTAFLFSPKKIVVVGLRATDRIDLGRWRSKQFPLRSAADFYELFTAWLWGALTKKKVP